MKSSPTAEEQLEYQKRCADCGFKPGDWILIRRKVESHSNGWNGQWHPEMDAMVGTEQKVTVLGDSTGSPKMNGFFFPYHALTIFEVEDATRASEGPPPMTDQFIPPPSE